MTMTASFNNKAYLRKQYALAKEFADFVTIILNRNVPCEIFIAVDQEIAPSSIVIGKEGRELLQYIGEWAIGTKLMIGDQITSCGPDEMPT
jgi:hypothetical protein